MFISGISQLLLTWFWPNFLDPIFWGPKFFWTTIFFTRFFLDHNFVWPKLFWFQHLLWPNNFRTKTCFEPKFFSDHNFLDSKYFGSNFFYHNFFWTCTIFWTENSFAPSFFSWILSEPKILSWTRYLSYQHKLSKTISNIMLMQHTMAITTTQIRILTTQDRETHSRGGNTSHSIFTFTLISDSNTKLSSLWFLFSKYCQAQLKLQLQPSWKLS